MITCKKICVLTMSVLMAISLSVPTTFALEDAYGNTVLPDESPTPTATPFVTPKPTTKPTIKPTAKPTFTPVPKIKVVEVKKLKPTELGGSKNPIPFGKTFTGTYAFHYENMQATAKLSMKVINLLSGNNAMKIFKEAGYTLGDTPKDVYVATVSLKYSDIKMVNYSKENTITGSEYCLEFSGLYQDKNYYKYEGVGTDFKGGISKIVVDTKNTWFNNKPAPKSEFKGYIVFVVKKGTKSIVLETNWQKNFTNFKDIANVYFRIK